MTDSAEARRPLRPFGWVSAVLAIAHGLGGCATLEIEPAVEEQATQRCLDRRASESKLPPSRFTTDGCSLFPDHQWQTCCIEHDMDYWCGGTATERAQADQELQQCAAAQGYPVTGLVMRVGTRLGGWWVLPTPWRWGYGWAWLSPMEQIQDDH